MPGPRIEVFFSQLCGGCHDAMDYFRNRGLSYDSYEIKWEAGGCMADGTNERELRRRLGDIDFVPQIFIGGKHVGGWRALTALIESGEVEELLGQKHVHTC